MDDCTKKICSNPTCRPIYFLWTTQWTGLESGPDQDHTKSLLLFDWLGNLRSVRLSFLRTKSFQRKIYFYTNFFVQVKLSEGAFFFRSKIFFYCRSLAKSILWSETSFFSVLTGTSFFTMKIYSLIESPVQSRVHCRTDGGGTYLGVIILTVRE